MNDIEKIRTLKAGLEATFRWISQGKEVKQHVEGGLSAEALRRQHYDDTYIADVLAIRRALAVKE